MSKLVKDAEQAFQSFSSGSSLMSGGFGLCGIPENSISYLASKKDFNNLTVISNNIGNSGRGLVALLKNNQISKAICSYVGGNPDLEQRILAEEIEIELVPQGTFAERIRSAGMGIRGFYTPTGLGTEIAEGKETKIIDGTPCLLELALKADFAIIKAQKADSYGNLIFKETAQNFSPLMAMAAQTTIVEVEELVELGDLDPAQIHLPGVFVQKVYQGQNYSNHIEFLTTLEQSNVG